MTQPHQPGQATFKTIVNEDINWQPFLAFPHGVLLAVLVGNPSSPGPYMIRVKVPSDAKLMPHKHSEDRIYTGLWSNEYEALKKRCELEP